MKKIFIALIMTAFAGIIFSSCEKQCVCYNRTTGSSNVIYNSYSLSDCRDWEKYYQTDPQVNPHGHVIECSYEDK